MSALPDIDPEGTEQRRRGLLEESDGLLDVVERLRLADRTRVPPELQAAMGRLQQRLGRADPARPATLRAAHNLLLAAQGRLLAANARSPLPRAHHGRGMGQPVFDAVAPGKTWKFLSLPPPSASPSREEWLARVDDTVERACDRWGYAHHQALRAIRAGQPAAAALAIADAAWNNYYELRREADRLRSGPELLSGTL